ncbi:nucleotidyl transferase AbiEii/AbiGii toxin family protein [Catenuloplanes japonicus]|uniref:nucleotidyl transferase AbiEii/AbiGii toxin family protein n=1 Tax=Catenuloplanes japonicus TaxID=33876 RepID=UPI0005254A10|nr:nucleotidyl transferase AbiEii/AbiGii toxin family protein [Catenuloplanes japonicus]
MRLHPAHARIARIALAVANRHGFALGGGLALIAHGVVHRPTEDVDLFSDVAGTVPAATRLVSAALRAEGFHVEEIEDETGYLGYHLAELEITDPDRSGVAIRVSLGELHRARSPVVLDLIGPVMDLADLRAWKVSALVSRAETRDYIDVAAFLQDTDAATLIDLARAVDPEIEPEDIARIRPRLDRMPDREFQAYGLDADQIAELRKRFIDWG